MRLSHDESGVEPLAMKLFAGIVLLVLGLGIGYSIYMWAQGGITQMTSFSVTVTPTSITVGIPATGSTTRTVSIDISKLGDYRKTVTLSATGVPEHVQVSFSPRSGVPSFGSTMTIQVDNYALSGTTTITIKATGDDGVERTGTLELRLE
jgi:uncharacterized membrane protein